MTPTKSFISSILSTIAVALGAVLLLGITLQPAMAKGQPQPSPSCSFTNNLDDSLTLTATGLLARYPKAEAKTDVTVKLDGNTITSARIQSDSYVATFTAAGDYTATFKKTTSGAALKASCSGTIEDPVVPDTTPPVFANLSGDITTEATSPDGAVATWDAPYAMDDVDGFIPVSCDRPSGWTYPIGTLTVTCTATDNSGNVAEDSFTVTVQDRSTPTLTLPASIVAEATGPGGAVVTYVATATDVADSDVVADCDPVSGSTFPMGTNTVFCSATDDAGNVAEGSFTVTVTADPTPASCVVAISQVPNFNGNYDVTVQYTDLTVGYEGDDLDTRFQARLGTFPQQPLPYNISQTAKDPNTDWLFIASSVTPYPNVLISATFTTLDGELKAYCEVSP